MSGCHADSFSFLLLLLWFSGSWSWDLVLLHTNDVHARVEETNLYSGKCGGRGGCFAGVARRSTLIERIRSSQRSVLLLDAGDQFQGSVWFSLYKGAEAAHFMNLLRYDAMVSARTRPLFTESAASADGVPMSREGSESDWIPTSSCWRRCSALHVSIL